MKSPINRYIAEFSFAAVILAAVLISCGSSPSPNSPRPAPSPQYSFEARRNIYMAIVRAEGLEPGIDVDGDIEFMRDGDSYYIVIDRDDPSFVFLYYPFWIIGSNEEKQYAAFAIGNANRIAKVAKAYFVNAGQGREGVVIGVELFLEDPNSMRALFSRMMGSIDDVKNSIYLQMD
jgi:hypothetical protein